jgi:hypothetical protein
MVNSLGEVRSLQVRLPETGREITPNRFAAWVDQPRTPPPVGWCAGAASTGPAQRRGSAYSTLEPRDAYDRIVGLLLDQIAIG